MDSDTSNRRMGSSEVSGRMETSLKCWRKSPSFSDISFLTFARSYSMLDTGLQPGQCYRPAAAGKCHEDVAAFTTSAPLWWGRGVRDILRHPFEHVVLCRVFRVSLDCLWVAQDHAMGVREC